MAGATWSGGQDLLAGQEWSGGQDWAASRGTKRPPPNTAGAQEQEENKKRHQWNQPQVHLAAAVSHDASASRPSSDAAVGLGDFALPIGLGHVPPAGMQGGVAQHHAVGSHPGSQVHLPAAVSHNVSASRPRSDAATGLGDFALPNELGQVSPAGMQGGVAQHHAVGFHPGSQDIISTQFEIPAHRVKDILGVRGSNIKTIKQKSGILKILIQDYTEPATVTVTGTQPAIEVAQSMVLQIVAGDQTCIGNISEQMQIDQRLVSKIIGPKGTVITNLKNQSGAYLEIRDTGAGQPPRIIMTGRQESVDKARELITQWIEENAHLVNGTPVRFPFVGNVVRVPFMQPLQVQTQQLQEEQMYAQRRREEALQQQFGAGQAISFVDHLQHLGQLQQVQQLQAQQLQPQQPQLMLQLQQLQPQQVQMLELQQSHQPAQLQQAQHPQLQLQQLQPHPAHVQQPQLPQPVQLQLHQPQHLHLQLQPQLLPVPQGQLQPQPQLPSTLPLLPQLPQLPQLQLQPQPTEQVAAVVSTPAPSAEPGPQSTWA